MLGVEVDYPPQPTRAIHALTRVRKDEVGDGTLVENVSRSLVPCLRVLKGSGGREGLCMAVYTSNSRSISDRIPGLATWASSSFR